MMVGMSSTTTFRLSDSDRRLIEKLTEELVCSRTDVLRLGMDALRRDADLRSQIRAENLARAFLTNLRTQYGENAVLELVDGPDDPDWKLAGEPIDSAVINVDVKRVGDRFVMNLIDPTTSVGIHNASSWTEADGSRHVVVPLAWLWVHSSTGKIASEPKTRQLYDGRTVVQIAEDDGSIKYFALDNDGNSRLLGPDEIPSAIFT
jgi:hypothetical protein